MLSIGYICYKSKTIMNIEDLKKELKQLNEFRNLLEQKQIYIPDLLQKRLTMLENNLIQAIKTFISDEQNK